MQFYTNSSNFRAKILLKDRQILDILKPQSSSALICVDLAVVL